MNVAVIEMERDISLQKYNRPTVLENTIQHVYNTDSQILIHGSNFIPEHTTLRFLSSTSMGKYHFAAESTSTLLILKLDQTEAHNTWVIELLITMNQPKILTLVSISIGDDFFYMKPEQPDSYLIGIDIATIYRVHGIQENNQLILHSGDELTPLHISYSNSGKYNVTSHFRFFPSLLEGVDYTQINSNTHCELKLLSGRVWRDSPGPIYVTAMSSRPGEDGWIEYPLPGIQVAQ